MPKEVTILESSNGYYLFRQLPALLADARFSSTPVGTSCIVSVIVWKDDDALLGSYGLYEPPEGVVQTEIAQKGTWRFKPLAPSPQLESWRKESIAQAREERRYWSDNELIIAIQRDYLPLPHDLNRAKFFSRVQESLEKAAQLSIDSPRHLVVVDELMLPIPVVQRNARRMRDSLVHIDEITKWAPRMNLSILTVGVTKPVGTSRTIRTRSDPITNAIEAALIAVADPSANQQVWNKLNEFARDGLHGLQYDEHEHITYRWEGETKRLTYKQLSDRLGRRRKKAVHQQGETVGGTQTQKRGVKAR